MKDESSPTPALSAQAEPGLSPWRPWFDAVTATWYEWTTDGTRVSALCPTCKRVKCRIHAEPDRAALSSPEPSPIVIPSYSPYAEMMQALIDCPECGFLNGKFAVCKEHGYAEPPLRDEREAQRYDAFGHRRGVTDAEGEG